MYAIFPKKLRIILSVKSTQPGCFLKNSTDVNFLQYKIGGFGKFKTFGVDCRMKANVKNESKYFTPSEIQLVSARTSFSPYGQPHNVFRKIFFQLMLN